MFVVNIDTYQVHLHRESPMRYYCYYYCTRLFSAAFSATAAADRSYAAVASDDINNESPAPLEQIDQRRSSDDEQSLLSSLAVGYLSSVCTSVQTHTTIDWHHSYF